MTSSLTSDFAAAMTAPFPHFPTHADPMREWGRLAPARVALVDRDADARVTYAELDRGAARWHALLAGAGVRAGDRVAVLAENRREVVELFHACQRAGVALVPLNWRLAAAELARVVGDARPALLVGEQRFRALAEEATRQAGTAPRWIDVDAEAPRLLAGAGDAPADASAHPEDPALVLYTSGSTGTPKGAVLPRRQILWNAIATTTSWQLGAADVAPVATPFFHTGGWNVFATPLWQRGGRIVLFRRFDAGDYLAGLAEERCSVAMVVPTQLVMMLEHARWGEPLPALRWLISGGAPCPASLAARVRAAGIAFRMGYGLTECGTNCFATSDEAALARPDSVGWPIAFLGTRVVREDGSACDADEPGELLLRGPQMFAGYLGAPEKTAEATTPDGWLRTGDLARRDADGAFVICGRRKEMFISGGENVFPGEVEAALADCPAVAEAVVIGVPDARWGEVGCAFVVRRLAAESADAAAVLAAARARLAGYKVPKRVVFLDELPRLGSGKPDRRALAAMAAAPGSVA